MKKSILGSVRFLILSTLIFGGLYTVFVTGVGQLFFSNQANGSQLVVDNQVIGSERIGQPFEQKNIFQDVVKRSVNYLLFQKSKSNELKSGQPWNKQKIQQKRKFRMIL